jgi:hypothetical protein
MFLVYLVNSLQDRAQRLSPDVRLLPYMQVCPDASSYLAYLCGFCPLRQRLPFATSCFVPARLR